jgi:hypothetical protein
MRAIALLLAAAAALPGQNQRRGAAGAPDIVLGNDTIELTISPTGGTFLKLVLREGEPLSPLAKMGHFLALDGFGAPSAEELAAGVPFHGEASKTAVAVVASKLSGDVRSVTLESRLPLAQEIFTRTIEVVEGESLVYVSSRLASQAAFDRPVSWAEHATLGPPFLEPGKVTVEVSAKRCRVRPQKEGSTGKLAYGADFDWPMAPLTAGGTVNLLGIPPGETSLDLAACQIDPARTYGFVTALRRDKGLIFGYVFRRDQYPWIMNWMNYTGDSRAARGIEFSTQPFDISHREAVEVREMFGTPAYKWLPAKSELRSRFVFFYARVPAGFGEVADVTPRDGEITITDRTGKTMALKARLGM